MKFLEFMAKRRDPFLKIKLTDLARTLARSPELEVNYAFHSYYKKDEDLVTVSNYWDELTDVRKEAAMKSDIYLRAYGNYFYTDYLAVSLLLEKIKELKHPQLIKQLFCIIEDIRLERLLIQDRPGMVHGLEARRVLLQKRFRERYSIHSDKGAYADALFCAFYLQLTGRPVRLIQPLNDLKPFMRELSDTFENFASTIEVVKAVLNFAAKLSSSLEDMTASYFTVYEAANETSYLEEREIKPELDSEYSKKLEKQEKKNTHDEKLPSWHQEDSEEGDNFLQFDLDQGSKTDLIGEGERKEESGDQAFASVQGDAKDSDGASFDQETLETGQKSTPTNQNQAKFGEANVHATLKLKKANKPSLENIKDYQTLRTQIQPILKPLQLSIQKTIEQKQMAPRTDLHFGRLNKKLLRAVTDQNPRLFYKKTEPSDRLDVTFTLLVDCSASMNDKMDQTKAGLVLFHEALSKLSIPHRIVGFWEDALDADETEQPNYLYEVISFEKSLQPKQGPNILQLEPEEDNRDGFVIRKAAEAMRSRPDKHKILLVFSDGEPSAFDYQDNGLVDTYEAVSTTRRQGMEVIGIFLSNGEAQEREKELMHHVYGRESLIIPSIEEIPAYLTPLLKKLILRYV